MFTIQNKKTGRTVRDMITCKPKMFESAEVARHFADGMERDSVLRATAWNSIRPTQYIVISDNK